MSNYYDECHLALLIRRPECDKQPESATAVAALAREIRELAEKRLGGEVVVDHMADRSEQ